MTDGGQETATKIPETRASTNTTPYPSQTLLCHAEHLRILRASSSSGCSPPSTRRPANVSWPVQRSNVNFFARDDLDRSATKKPGGTVLLHAPVDAINGANTCFNCNPDIHVAIDNSDTFSEGRVYLSLTSPENDVEVFDAEQRPVDFPATASYITENKLTGTPSGPFGEVGYVTVDSHGNIYVTDCGKRSSTSSTRPGPSSAASRSPRAASALGPATGGVAVDPTNGNVLITEGGYNAETEEGGVKEYDASGNYLGTVHRPERHRIPAAGRRRSSTRTDTSTCRPAADLTSSRRRRRCPRSPTSRSPSPTTHRWAPSNATVDPNGGGAVTECKFEYGTTTGYGTTAGCSDPRELSLDSPTDVSAPLSGLTTETDLPLPGRRPHARTASSTAKTRSTRRTRSSGLRTEAATQRRRSRRDPERRLRRQRRRNPLPLRMGPDGRLRTTRPTAAAGQPGHGVSEPLPAPTHRPRPLQHLPLPRRRQQRWRHERTAKTGCSRRPPAFPRSSPNR